MRLCPNCNGNGVFSDSAGVRTCRICDGRGEVATLEQQQAGARAHWDRQEVERLNAARVEAVLAFAQSMPLIDYEEDDGSGWQPTDYAKLFIQHQGWLPQEPKEVQ